jgi:hypothetical protein
MKSYVDNMKKEINSNFSHKAGHKAGDGSFASILEAKEPSPSFSLF